VDRSGSPHRRSPVLDGLDEFLVRIDWRGHHGPGKYLSGDRQHPLPGCRNRGWNFL